MIERQNTSSILDNVALVCTVYNEASTIEQFLDSISSLTKCPAEIVIVDGGSIDGTIELISKYNENCHPIKRVHLIVDPRCNIQFTPGPVGKGRNIAIRHTASDIIACTDAGCMLDKYWLERITAPLLSDSAIDVVGGYSLPYAVTFFEQCVARVVHIPAEAINPKTFLPSSRSIAFRKGIWARVGGYPENSLTGEDTIVAMKMRESGIRIEYKGDAIVYWRMKSTLRSFVKMVYRYGFGDGFNSILPINVFRNLLKIGIALGLILLGIILSPWFVVFLIIYWWLLPFAKKMHEAFKPSHIFEFPVVALLKVTSDSSYVAGYLAGKIRARQSRFLKSY